MAKGSRFAFQTGILLLCGWVCKPIVTLEAGALQVPAGQAPALAQGDKPPTPSVHRAGRTPILDVSRLGPHWPGARSALIRGPVDPFTYRPSSRETPVFEILKMFAESVEQVDPRTYDFTAADPVTRRYLEVPASPFPEAPPHSWLQPLVLGVARHASGAGRPSLD